MKKSMFSLLLCLLLSLNLATLSSANPSSAPVKIIFPGVTEITLDQVDGTRVSDGFSMFTGVYGSFTPSFDSPTVEYIISDSVVIAVNNKGLHGTYIPKNGFVLSVSGSAQSSMPSVNIGDTVQLTGMTLPVLPSQYVLINGIAIPVDSVNSFRTTGYAVLYQPSYGPSTNTNPWGLEITVSGDKVADVASLKGNAAIPSDGYVLSIHIDNPYYDQLQGKVEVGMAAKLSMNDAPLYEAAKTNYDAFDPKVRDDNPVGWDDAHNQPYPGFRGADQLIVYDSKYGSATGTNPWGYEVTVDANGKIVSLAGNNSAIPAGGMVLSGHGVKADWLQKYARVGASVILKPATKELLLVFTPDSYLDRARVSISLAQQGLQQSKDKFMDVPYAAIQQKIDAAQTKFDQLKAQMDDGDFTQIFTISADIDSLVNDAYFTNFESRKVENRGIWVRPLETTAEEVKQHVEQIAAANLNTIYLETWWDGYTIYPTDNTITRQNPIYHGFDVLRAYLDEAHKHNIEVQAWVENFFIGDELAMKKPEWLIQNRKGETYESHDGLKWYWLNPALPAARDFVAGVYKELIQKYDIQGLHLDYIRYPESGDYTNDFGYDPYTRGLFKDQYGVDPITIHRGDELWDEWVKFRDNMINTFVYRIVPEAKALNPNIKISAAVMSDFDIAPEYKLQDAKDWVSKNYIDQLLPMTYTFDVDSIVAETGKTLAFAKDKTYVVIGLGPYLRVDKKVVAGQVDGTFKNGGAGTGMFEFIGFFGNRYDKELKLGLYRDTAVVPDRNPAKSLGIVLNEMKRKINEIYVPSHGMESSSKYVQKLDNALDILKPGTLNAGKAQALRVHLEGMAGDLQSDAGAQEPVKARMMTDINFALQIVNIYTSKLDAVTAGQ